MEIHFSHIVRYRHFGNWVADDRTVLIAATQAKKGLSDVRYWLVASVAIIALLAIARPAGALPQPTYNGLVVSPALVQLGLSKGQSSTSFTTEVTNDSSASVTIAVRVDDFTALDTSGTPQFLNNVARSASPHGLAHWMVPDINQFSLRPEQSKTVSITVADVSSLAPGGHYGAVIFAIVPQAGGSQQNVISANASVSTLVFLTTNNPGTMAISLARPSISSLAFGLPIAVDVVFSNTGDVQTTPRGTVSLLDRNGTEVAQGIINTDSGLILPSTKRLYHVQLVSANRASWPGMYQVRVRYHYDGQTTDAVYTQGLVYIPAPAIAVVGALVLLGAVLVLRRLLPGRFVRVTRL